MKKVAVGVNQDSSMCESGCRQTMQNFFRFWVYKLLTMYNNNLLAGSHTDSHYRTTG